MSAPPRVSVVTTFLDPPAAFFREAIDSVMSQTFRDWELLLVNDGSGDESTRIAQEYEAREPRIRLLGHEGHAHRGMGASRNLAFRHARGEYIAFLDADDVWLPDKIERQIPVLELWPEAGLTYWNTLSWYSWTNAPADRGRDRTRNLGLPLDRLLSPPLAIVYYLQGRADIPVIGSVLARRSAIESVGGFEDEYTGLYEDQVFYARMMLSHPIVVTTGWREKYRRHPRASTKLTRTSGGTYEEHRKYIEWLNGYLSGTEWEGTELWRLARRRLWYTHHRRLEAVTDAARIARKRTVRRTKNLARRLLGKEGARRVRSRLVDRVPRVGRVRFGHLRRQTPISRRFGFDRGGPIDRYYIEGFLDRHRGDIRGRVLEFGDDAYTRRFGDDRVEISNVLHVNEDNPAATFVADLATADHVPSEAFDCVVCTQTLQLIFDLRAAVETLYRILKPGGVALVTIPGITQMSHDEWGATWYWRFTPLSARRLFERVFPAEHVEVGVHGNVLAATAFLQGISAVEVEPAELDFLDPRYDLVITVRATKPSAP
jgi:glycosyltransferase involved in cell wall biosynthesis